MLLLQHATQKAMTSPGSHYLSCDNVRMKVIDGTYSLLQKGMEEMLVLSASSIAHLKLWFRKPVPLSMTIVRFLGDGLLQKTGL